MSLGFGVGIQRLGSFGVPTRAALLALPSPGSNVRPTGFVYADTTPANNGIYTWNGSTWTRQRGLTEDIATLTVTGGTANAITATAPDGVALSDIAIALLVPSSTNTGAVTLNGKSVVDATGTALVSGALVAGKVFALWDDGTNWRALFNQFGAIADIVGLTAALAAKADASALATAISTLNSADATKVDKSGSTMTGPLTLYGDASNPLEPIAFQQVPKLVGSLQGAFKNLLLSADGLSAAVTISFDELVLETTANAYRTVRNQVLSLSLAASGANGLDTGSVAVSSWYSVWTIYNPTTQTVAALGALVPSMTGTFTSGSAVVTGITSTANLAVGMPVSGANIRPGSVIRSVDSGTQVTLSRTAITTGSASLSYVAAPVMPSGYTYKARVGMVYTEAGANKYPLAFMQVGRRQRWTPVPASNLASPRAMATLVNGAGSTAIGVAAFIPPTSALLMVEGIPPNGSSSLWLHGNKNFAGIVSQTYPPYMVQNTTSSAVSLYGDIPIESLNIYGGVTGGNGVIFAIGYEDNI